MSVLAKTAWNPLTWLQQMIREIGLKGVGQVGFHKTDRIYVDNSSSSPACDDLGFPSSLAEMEAWQETMLEAWQETMMTVLAAATGCDDSIAERLLAVWDRLYELPSSLAMLEARLETMLTVLAAATGCGDSIAERLLAVWDRLYEQLELAAWAEELEPLRA